MNSYIDAWRKYGVFRGRATRGQFWAFIGISIGVWLGVIALAAGIVQLTETPYIGQVVLVWYWLYPLAAFLPTLAIQVRRLHDVNQSGWLVLIGWTGIGPIVLLVFYLMGSKPDNKYGPNPIGPAVISPAPTRVPPPPPPQDTTGIGVAPLPLSPSVPSLVDGHDRPEATGHPFESPVGNPLGVDQQSAGTALAAFCPSCGASLGGPEDAFCHGCGKARPRAT